MKQLMNVVLYLCSVMHAADCLPLAGGNTWTQLQAALHDGPGGHWEDVLAAGRTPALDAPSPVVLPHLRAIAHSEMQ